MADSAFHFVARLGDPNRCDLGNFFFSLRTKKEGEIVDPPTHRQHSDISSRLLGHLFFPLSLSLIVPDRSGLIIGDVAFLSTTSSLPKNKIK